MKKIAVLIFVFALNYTPIAFALDVAPRARVEAMFKSFAPGKIEMAIDVFAKDSLIPRQTVDQTKSQTKTILTPDKAILGFEFVQEQNVGESVKRLSYILKLSDRPVFWTFSFYKPESIWIPVNIAFSSEY